MTTTGHSRDKMTSEGRSGPRQSGDLALLPENEDLDNDPQYMKSLGRALDVLRAFRAGDSLLGNSDLAERTGLPASTVSRITYTLARCGFLQFNRRFRMYELGAESFAVGQVALANLDVRRLARPRLQQFAASAGFNVGMATRDRTSMIFTDAFESEALVGLRLFPGARLPIALSSIGRAYIAALPGDEYAEILTELEPRYADWPRVAEGIESAKAQVEEKGFCVSLGDWQENVYGVAAPIRTPFDGQLFAINIGGPSFMLEEERLWTEFGPAIADIAREIEAMMAVS
ncbi:IclR family transcriptional regulator [Sphingopyxis sp.]|jgi:DNA-binding IclR family transcriptional regulator|uniref:IclR family transcriptional regulator n=1 Tax=Sphingopyxis sp. TaxID=1908224 RepID=UPI002DE99B81|nr:IclR family transcriptional regulator [Sphingopyxis sp.]